MNRTPHRHCRFTTPTLLPMLPLLVVIAVVAAGVGAASPGAASPTGASAGAASADAKALERCRYLHDRIEHYTRLRRAGGKGPQMERWRKARQTYEREYRERRCYRFGSRLTLRP